MAKVNVYKIDEHKHRDFLTNMSDKLFLAKEVTLTLEDNHDMQSDMVFSLFKSGETDQKNVSWEWILTEFEEEVFQTSTQPKAVVVVEYEDEVYAITFGHSYFLVDKYCDRDFAFSFARRTDFKEIKTTALTSPNSQRNKTINTYIDYSNLEFDSGESFSKLKAKVRLNDDFDVYKDLIEAGNSLKFNLIENSIQNIKKLILHIILVLEKDVIYNIPVFSKISDKELILKLDESLEKQIQDDLTVINISEIDIIGATEVFNNNDTTFTISYKNLKEEISNLSKEEVEKFANQNNLLLGNVILDIKVISYFNGISVRTDKIRNLIDYVDDEQRCILSKGEWYHFNDDYQVYLEDSIAEIEVIYNPAYDFSQEIHRNFIDEKFKEEHSQDKYRGMELEKVWDKIKTKYYAERTFNLLREKHNGYENYDREESRLGKAKVELMDLYKEETMYAVKIGNTSSKLCYAIDQSLSSLKLYKHQKLESMPIVKNVAVWFILERNKLSSEDGKPNLNELEMLMLKNKLDIWKKEVRVLGYNPVVYINYRS